VFAVFATCESDGLLFGFSLLLSDILARSPLQQAVEFVTVVIDRLEELMRAWRRIQFVMLALERFIEGNAPPIEVQSEWALKLIDFVLGTIAAKRSPTFLKEVAFGEIFACLAAMFAAVTPELFERVYAAREDVMLSAHTSPSFLLFMDCAIESGFVSEDEFAHAMASAKPDVEDDVLCNFFVGSIVNAQGRENLEVRYAKLSEHIPPQIQGQILVSVLASRAKLRAQVLLFPGLLIFPLLVSPQMPVRIDAEKAIVELFPGLQPLTGHIRAEEYLDRPLRFDLEDNDGVDDHLKTCHVDPEDEIVLCDFIENLGEFCYEIAGSVESYLQGVEYPQCRFTGLFRTIHWAVDRSDTYPDRAQGGVWDLLQAIGASEWSGGCNTLECLSTLLSFDEEGTYQLIDSDVEGFVKAVMPLGFEKEFRLNVELFMRVIELAAGRIEALGAIPEFRVKFAAFLEFIVSEPKFSTRLYQLSDMAEKNATLAAGFVSLLDIFKPDEVPVAILPIVLSSSVELDDAHYVVVLRAAMFLFEMLFDDSPALRIILESCSTRIFEYLGPRVQTSADALEICRPTVPALCQHFMSGTSGLYRRSMLVFLHQIASIDREIARTIITNLAEGHHEISLSPTIVWDCLRLRLLCGEAAESLLDDAIVAGQAYNQAYAANFIEELIRVIRKRDDREHLDDRLRQFLTSLEESLAWEVQSVRDIEDVVTETGDVLEGLREASMIRD
jgi:hypothetical protein